MTCIVAFLDVRDGKVYMGADTSVSFGDVIRAEKATKIVEKNGIMMGVAGTSRIAQYVMYFFKPPDFLSGEEFRRYMVVDFVPELKKELTEYGYKEPDFSSPSGASLGFEMIVAHKDHLALIGVDFSVVQHVDNIEAIGSGSDFAFSAMKALFLAGMLPESYEIIKIALQCASVQAHCNDKVVVCSTGG